MADFALRVTQGATVGDWNDLAVPMRTNPEPGHPLRNYQVAAGTGVVVKATPDGGAEGDLDVDLDGRLFTHWFAEHPISAALPITSAAGNSSVVSFVPMVPGNYLLVFYREEGGSMSIPIEVVTPP